jgi:hypothetical protein
MSLRSNFHFVINFFVANSILLIVALWYAYLALMDYRFIEIYSKPIEQDDTKFNSALESLKITIDDILSSSSNLILENQDFKITGPCCKNALVGELAIEFQDKYLNLLDLLKDLEESKILSKISYLKIKKNPLGPLSIGLKSYIIVQEDKQNDEKTN